MWRISIASLVKLTEISFYTLVLKLMPKPSQTYADEHSDHRLKPLMQLISDSRAFNLTIAFCKIQLMRISMFMAK